MDLKDLINDRREIEIEYQGETVEAVYRPAAYTPATENAYLDKWDKSRSGDAVADFLSRVLVSWDVTNEGQPYPPTLENLQGLPTQFLAAVIEAIGNDVRADKEDRKNSDGRSPQAASKANSRRGMR